MKKIIVLISICMSCLMIFAQTFHYQANLPSVDNTGFYKIQLTSAINAKLKDDFTDFRIKDKDGKEAPYILKDDNPQSYSSEFKEYQIVDKKYLKDSITQIILKNKTKEKINNISLVIRNAEVHKGLKLSGSFDRRQWFVVKENMNLTSISNSKDVSEIKLIDFPLTDYEFFKIEINDKNSSPIDIIKAGYYETSEGKGGSTFTELKSLMTVVDSAKKKTTWVHITLEESLYADVLEMNITEPEYYLRNVKVYAVMPDSTGFKRYYNQDIILNSKAPLRFNLNRIKTKELWLEIFNEDNKPLKISDAKVFQLNHYCIANLEKDKQYKLYFGDIKTNAPQYDLKYFQSVIPEDLKVIIPDSITSITQPFIAENKTSKGVFADKRFIWAALIIVALVLGFVTYKMMKDMK